MPDRSKRGFSDRSVDRIIDVVRRAEALPVYELGSEGPANGDVPHPLEQWVKVTSLTQTAGRYPGQWYDDRVKPWVAKGSAGDIWVVVPNDDSLSLGKFYRGNVCELLSDGKLVFNVVVIGPADGNGAVQFNDGGVFGGSGSFTYTKSTGKVEAVGPGQYFSGKGTGAGGGGAADGGGLLLGHAPPTGNTPTETFVSIIQANATIDGVYDALSLWETLYLGDGTTRTSRWEYAEYDYDPVDGTVRFLIDSNSDITLFGVDSATTGPNSARLDSFAIDRLGDVTLGLAAGKLSFHHAAAVTQGAALTDLGGGATLADAITAINAVNNRLRRTGYVAT